MVNVTVDTRRFDRDLELYLKHTSKTIVDAVNFKLYDAARAAIKGTEAAKKPKIKESLEAISTKYPNRTVAQMIVIEAHHQDGTEIKDFEQEAKKLIKTRQSHTAFTKAGWIPALKQLLSYVGKSFATVSGTVKPAYGGAEPARTTGGKVVGSVFNDVLGTGNYAFVDAIKRKGSQAALDKVSLDMEQYLSKKLDIPIAQFNSSH